MSETTIVEQDQVTEKMTQEQYVDLTDSLDAIARHLDDFTKLEAVINFFRDRKCLHMPLGEILRELQDASPTQNLWHNQAMHKHRDLTGLIAHVRNLCEDRLEGPMNKEKRKDEIVSPNCAA
ncbi:MAG: hypothetical protein WC975_14955 [Phycisphaerae bacterium]